MTDLPNQNAFVRSKGHPDAIKRHLPQHKHQPRGNPTVESVGRLDVHKGCNFS